MTNEQLSLLLRGLQFRVRAILRRFPYLEAAQEDLEQWDNELTRDIRDLLRLDTERGEKCQSRE